MTWFARAFRSLKVRIIVLVVTVFVAIYLFAVYVARDFIDSSNYEVAKQLVGQQAKLTRERTLSFFDRDQKLIETGIENGVYQAWMKESGNNKYLRTATESLQVNCRILDCFGWFIFAHQSRDGYTFNREMSEPVKIGLKDHDMVWYQPLIHSGKTIYIDSNFDENFKIQGVFLDYVVREGRSVLGVVGYYVKVDYVLDLLLSDEEEGISNLLIDDKQTIRIKQSSDASSDKFTFNESYANASWEMLIPNSLQIQLERLQANRDNTVITEILQIDGERYLAAIAYIDQVEWFSLSLFPLDSQLSYFDVTPVFLVSLIVLLLFIALSITLLNQQVFRPVKALSDVVDDIHNGHYDVKTDKVGTDLIQHLGDRIEEMATQIATQIEQLEASNNALKVASDEATNASKAKSLFLSNMSHEIRTPLNAILGTLQLLERGALDISQENLVKRSLYSARTLMTIINDILDYSKIEANEMILEKTEFEILQVIDSIESDLAADALMKGVTLQCMINERFVDGWLGDPVRVRQIILNLVSNAVKFTEQGSVTIRVSQVSVDKGEGIFIEVEDTGIGMTLEEQQQICQRFTQADASTTRRFGGTGLGMAISTNLIELMGGTICIDSEKGKGTKFSVRLPLDKAEVKEALIEQENIGIPELSHARILIAEDNEINQEIITAMLEPTSAKLDVVANGVEAVEAAKSQQYDLILMDIQMPEMDGIAAFKAIRELAANLPIVALTANVMNEDVQHYSELGFNAHIGKPIDMNLLYSTLNHFVETQKRTA